MSEKGTKLSNARSSLPKPAAVVNHERRQEFEERIDEAQVEKENYQREMIEAGQSFNKLLADRTLPVNRGPVSKSMENEAVLLLYNLALKGNELPLEAGGLEGLGSLGVQNFLLKGLLYFRDRCNTLEYELHLIKEKLEVKESTESK